MGDAKLIDLNQEHRSNRVLLFDERNQLGDGVQRAAVFQRLALLGDAMRTELSENKTAAALRSGQLLVLVPEQLRDPGLEQQDGRVP